MQSTTGRTESDDSAIGKSFAMMNYNSDQDDYQLSDNDYIVYREIIADYLNQLYTKADSIRYVEDFVTITQGMIKQLREKLPVLFKYDFLKSGNRCFGEGGLNELIEDAAACLFKADKNQMLDSNGSKYSFIHFVPYTLKYSINTGKMVCDQDYWFDYYDKQELGEAEAFAKSFIKKSSDRNIQWKDGIEIIF